MPGKGNRIWWETDESKTREARFCVDILETKLNSLCEVSL